MVILNIVASVLLFAGLFALAFERRRFGGISGAIGALLGTPVMVDYVLHKGMGPMGAVLYGALTVTLAIGLALMAYQSHVNKQFVRA